MVAEARLNVLWPEVYSGKGGVPMGGAQAGPQPGMQPGGQMRAFTPQGQQPGRPGGMIAIDPSGRQMMLRKVEAPKAKKKGGDDDDEEEGEDDDDAKPGHAGKHPAEAPRFMVLEGHKPMTIPMQGGKTIEIREGKEGMVVIDSSGRAVEETAAEMIRIKNEREARQKARTGT